MGRFSTVQAYSDNNPNMRAISHSDTAAKSANASLKTEKVHNPYGSTAGAGSGEFHIYRHARAREMERLKAIDEKDKETQDQQEFDSRINNWKQDEEEKLNKKRKKRMRNKSSKMRKKNMSLSGVILKNSNDGNDNIDDEEFEYTPMKSNGEKEIDAVFRKIDKQWIGKAYVSHSERNMSCINIIESEKH